MTTDGTASDLPDDLAAPARRALSQAGYTRLEQLTTVTEKDLLDLHGMGTKAIDRLREALAATGRSFKES
jgi:DNA-directed RNA polymerase alpha subunit